MTTEQTTTPAVAPVHVGTAHAAPQGTGEAPAPVQQPVVPAPGAPVAPAAPVAPPAPAIPEPTSDGKLEPTGDPGLDLAIEFVNAAGIKGNDPAIEAAREGDFTLLEAKLAALGDKAKGWERHVALAKQAFERHTAAVEAENAKVRDTVFSVVGGEANWKAIQAFASANASPEEKAQINAAFAAGGLQAKSAAIYLAQVYQKAQAKNPGYKEPAAPVKPNAPAGGDGTTPMTARAYAQAVAKLQAQAKGRDVSGTPEYAALQQQRLAAKRAGY